MYIVFSFNFQSIAQLKQVAANSISFQKHSAYVADIVKTLGNTSTLKILGKTETTLYFNFHIYIYHSFKIWFLWLLKFLNS